MRTIWSRVVAFIGGLIRWDRPNSDLDDEVRFHLEMLIEQHTRRGMSPEEARTAALRAFGGVTQMKELYRDQRGLPWLETLIQDARYGMRTLRRTPGFTFAAVLSLALGIGANTAIFSLIDAVMLKRLPVREPDRLVEPLVALSGSTTINAFSYQALVHFRDHASTVQAVVASHSTWFFVVGEDRTPELSDGQYVTGNFFEVLGVGVRLGRVLQPADDRPGAERVALLSYPYWQRRFAADPAVIGRSVTIEDRRFTIVGVTAPEFRGTAVGADVALWLPLSCERTLRKQSYTTSAGYKWLQILARLKPGVSIEQASAEFGTLFQRAVIDAEVALSTDADSHRRARSWRLALESAGAGLSRSRRQYAEPLFVLLGVSGAVLLIGCVNVASLLVARGSARGHEMAVRLSLGAGRVRLIRQLLTESLLLALAGGAVGVALAYAGSHYLLDFLATSRTPIVLDVRPDLRVLAFTTVLSLATGILFGLAPAWRTTAPRGASALTAGTRVRGSGRVRRGPGRWLIGSQVAVSVILLFSAGLFLRSLHNLRSIDTGFDRESVLLVATDAWALSHSGLNPEDRRLALREALRRLGALPGVQSASFCWVAPITGGGTMRTVAVDGGGEPREARDMYLNWVGPNYFAVLRTPILAGRDFDWRDTITSPKVAIVNETMARRHFPDGRAVGGRITLDRDTFEIVAVVGDAKYLEVRDATPSTVYFHAFQQEQPSGSFALRTISAPMTMAEAARREIREAAPSVAVIKVWTLAEQVDASIVRERMLGTLSAFFAALGLLLAAVGLYGVMAYTVTRRTSEIGIRMALGARPAGIARMVIGEIVLLTLCGVVVGMALALVLARSLSGLLYGLQPSDPVVIAGAALVMLVTAAAAGFVPSRRASRLNPVDALRQE
jgi:predicted permease